MKSHSGNKFFSLLALAFLFLGISMVVADELAERPVPSSEQDLTYTNDKESEANLNAYIEEATKSGTQPKAQPSKYWRKGYTCNDLKRYSWVDYRDCSYFYRYYGYYWPY